MQALIKNLNKNTKYGKHMEECKAFEEHTNCDKMYKMVKDSLPPNQ